MRTSVLLPALTRLSIVLGLALSACDSEPAVDSAVDTDTDEPESSDGEPPEDEGTTGMTEGSTGDDPGSTSDADGPAAACDDGEHNGDEVDVDCGGSCQPCPPPGWACEGRFYGDGICQCGCDVADVDCSGASPSECAYALCPDGEALVPGQTVDCVETPETPAQWECSAASFGDSSCDCGCGAPDFDCETDLASACADTHCADYFTLDPADNASCLPPPEASVLNPSFEDTPEGSGDVPGWTVLDDVGGIASVAVVGQGQTTAPDGTRALRMESLNDTFVGARTVRSSPFLPPAGMCTVTVAIGDSNEDSEFTDFGRIRVRTPSMSPPLDLVAEVEIDNRGMGGVSPPTEGYADASVTFAADGTSLYLVEIRVRGSYGFLSYHADDVRIDCSV